MADESPPPELIVMAEPHAAKGVGLSNAREMVGEYNAVLERILPQMGDAGQREFHKVEGVENEETALELAEKLNQDDDVQAAYVKPPAEPAVADISQYQYYLGSKYGLNVDLLHTLTGGRGAGVQVADVERGYNPNHIELAGKVTSLHPIPATVTDVDHGTAVLSVIGGKDDGQGIKGIASDATLKFSTSMDVGTATAIKTAADALNAGDILLIEVQRTGPRYGFKRYNNDPESQRGMVAIEWWPDDFDAVKYATDKGVIVLSCAGNGYENLDDAIYDARPAGFPTSWKNPFKRALADSGSIVIGAGYPYKSTYKGVTADAHARAPYSNYGSVLDAQNWGMWVAAAGYNVNNPITTNNPNEYYTRTFSGTSSAGAVTAGALAALQGALKGAGKPSLTPPQMRTALRLTGVSQASSPDTGNLVTARIGNQVDLKELLVYTGLIADTSSGRTLDAQTAYFEAMISEKRTSSGVIYEPPLKTTAIFLMDKLGGRAGSEIENIHPATAVADVRVSSAASIIDNRLITQGVSGSYADTDFIPKTRSEWGSDYYFMIVDAAQASADGAGAIFAIAAQNDHNNYAKVVRDSAGALQLQVYDKGTPSGVRAALPVGVGLQGAQLFRIRVRPPVKRVELALIGSGNTAIVDLPTFTWSGQVNMSFGTTFRGYQGPDNARVIRGADTFARSTHIGAMMVAGYTTPEDEKDVRALLQANYIVPTLTLAAQSSVAYFSGSSVTLTVEQKALTGQLVWALSGAGELADSGTTAVYTPPTAGTPFKARITVSVQGTTYTQYVDIDVRAAQATSPDLRNLVDAKFERSFSVANTNYPADIKAYLQRVADCVAQEKTSAVPADYPKNPGENPTLCMASMLKERIGRNVAYYIDALHMLGRITGAPWAYEESVRLLKIARPRLSDWHPHASDRKDGYKNLRFAYEGYGADQAVSNNDKNAKELLLGWSAIAHMTFLVKENAADADERALADWWLDILLNHAEPAMKISQNESNPFNSNPQHPQHDPYKFIAVDRVMHPYLRSIEYCVWMYKMTGEQRYLDVINLRLPRALVNFTSAPDAMGMSREAMVWAMEVRGISGASLSTIVASHMAVYAPMCADALVTIALEGYGDFTDTWLETLHHGMTTAFVHDAPFQVKSPSGNMATKYVYKTLLGSWWRNYNTAANGAPRSAMTINSRVSAGDGFIDVNGHRFLESKSLSSTGFGYYRAESYPRSVPVNSACAWGHEVDEGKFDKHLGKPGAWKGDVAAQNAIGVAYEAFGKIYKHEKRSLT